VADGNLWDKFLRFVGFETDDADQEPEEEFEQAPAPAPARPSFRERTGGRVSEMQYDDFSARARSTANAQSRMVGMSGGVQAQNAQSAQMKMILFQPMSYGDTETIVDNVRANKPVVINVEQLDVEVSQRVLDYVTGAAYALGGTIRRVSRGIFLVVPNNVDISGNLADNMRGKGSLGLGGGTSRFTTE